MLFFRRKQRILKQTTELGLDMVDVKVNFVERFGPLDNKLGKLSRTNQLKVALIRPKLDVQRICEAFGVQRLLATLVIT